MIIRVPRPALACTCLLLRDAERHHRGNDTPTQAQFCNRPLCLSVAMPRNPTQPHRSDPARPKSEPPPTSPPPMIDHARRCGGGFPRPVSIPGWGLSTRARPSIAYRPHSGKDLGRGVTLIRTTARHRSLAVRRGAAVLDWGELCRGERSVHPCEPRQRSAVRTLLPRRSQNVGCHRSAYSETCGTPWTNCDGRDTTPLLSCGLCCL
jgi:hypothetical protein